MITGRWLYSLMLVALSSSAVDKPRLHARYSPQGLAQVTPQIKIYRYQVGGQVVFSDTPPTQQQAEVLWYACGDCSVILEQVSHHKQDIDAAINLASARFSLDPQLIRAVIAVESNFDPQAISHKGAMGLMQLMPATATELGVDDPFQATANIMGGTAYLAKLLHRFDDLPLALAAYNAGASQVERYGGVPPFAETQAYVQKVLRLYQQSL